MLAGCSKGSLPELQALARADEAESKQAGVPAQKLFDDEELRLAEVLKLRDGGKLGSPVEKYLAARVLNHGHSSDQYRLAHELAKEASDAGVREARWLAAEAQDRYRMSLRRPQLYGTQFEYDEAAKAWKLYPVDPAITDEERRWWDVRSLDESRALVDELNREGLSKFSARLRTEHERAILDSIELSSSPRKN